MPLNVDEIVKKLEEEREERKKKEEDGDMNK